MRHLFKAKASNDIFRLIYPQQTFSSGLAKALYLPLD